ncbi:MAG: serine/threonine-protein kinase, partial [Holophagales bacterium]|nr:serine/threonine-protein kinase [Holophagales bacterium]
MNPDRWRRLKEVFLAAADLPAAERSVLLEQMCASDPALREEAERLLAAEVDSPPILQVSPAHLLRLPEGSPTDGRSRVGDTVGPYRILRTLGEGGMGTVYLAERHDLEQRVALKVLRGARADPKAVQRFLGERRILAQLEHPHIARLLDAGITEDGAPFFTMEHVPGGRTLTAYCSDQRLALEDRLTLFLEACDAVWYAHRCLIIHRDLKPSNILVMEDEDGKAIVKLVDFGIAKRLPGSLEASELTRTGSLVMTPSYAAPEQVRGEVLTTAADIYALGIVLFELLAGRRPYEIEGLPAAEVERRICETEPPRPSSALRRAAGPVEPATASTPWVPSSAERLRGDLDHICLRALAKEPCRRYASVDALRADLRRHLTGLPIQARPWTAGYRMTKLVRRHRSALVAATLVGLALVCLVAFYSWQLAAERDRVAASLAESEAVTDFLIGLFEANHPDVAGTESVTGSTLLARGLERADDLAEQPNVQARMLDAIGMIQVKLGSFAAALQPLERAFALRLEHLGWHDPATLESAHNLSVSLRRLARYDEAEAMLRDAFSRVPDLEERLPFHAGAMYHELGTVLSSRGEHSAAEDAFRRAVRMKLAAPDTDAREQATALNGLAFVLHQQGKLSEAEALYRKALHIHLRQFGPVHTQVALVQNNLGVLLLDRGERDRNRADYEAAEQMLKGSLEIRRQLLGPEHPSLATTLNNIASSLLSQDRRAEAVAAHRQALAIRRSRLGDEHPEVTLSRHNLGWALLLHGQHDEAAIHLRSALAQRQQRL